MSCRVKGRVRGIIVKILRKMTIRRGLNDTRRTSHVFGLVLRYNLKYNKIKEIIEEVKLRKYGG